MSEVPQAQRFRFTGTTGEYFRIWIVNLLLTVGTLGAYGPWAKIRKRRWLYGHTWLAGSNFDFHGDPWAVFRGRAVAVVAFGAYTALGLFAPRAATAALVALAPLAPFLLLGSMRFVTGNSSFRNLRFAFRGRYRDAAKALAPLLVWPLALLTPGASGAAAEEASWGDLGLLLVPVLAGVALHPYMMAARWRLRIAGSAYGRVPFRCGAGVRAFYALYVRAALLAAGCGLLAMLAGVFVRPWLVEASGAVWVLAVLAGLGFVALAPLAYTRAGVANLALGRTRVGDALRVRSRLSAARLAWLYAGNTLAVAASLGLLVPWAVVRTARYRAGTLALAGAGDLDAVLGGVGVPAGAAADELAGLFDLELSL